MRHCEEDTESLLGHHADTRIDMEEEIDIFPETRFHDSIIP